MQTRTARWSGLTLIALGLLAGSLSPACAKGPFALGLVVSPDGSRLYLAGQVLQGHNSLVTTLWTIDTATLQVVATVQPKGNPYLTSLAVSADGSRLYLSRDGRVDVVDARTGQPLAAIQAGPTLLSLAPSADGRRLYGATMDWTRPAPHQPAHPKGGLAVMDTARSQTITTLDMGWINAFAIVSPDNRRVYALTSSDSGSIAPVGDTLKTVDAETLQVVAATSLGGMARAAAISPDGSRLYLTTFGPSPTQAQVTIIDTSTALRAGVVAIPEPQYIFTSAPAISPDGKQLYVPMSGGPASVRVLDTDTLKFTGALTLPGGAAFLALSPDGKRLYTVDQPGDTITAVDTNTLQVEATLKPGAATSARN